MTSVGASPDNIVHTREMFAQIERKVMLEKLQGIDRSDPDWDMTID